MSIVNDADGRRTDGRQLDGYTISSPCEPNGSGELKSQHSLVKFCLLVLKILSGNEILTSIKGRNSVANLRNLTLYNPNLDIINVNVYTKFG